MRKCFVFDFDDTIATTTARIKVMDKAGLVTHIRPRELSNFKLKASEYFDFSEFRDSDMIKDAKPTFLLDLAKEVDEEGHDIYILTAREDDSADAIREFLTSYDIRPRMIHCVGGSQKNIPEKKRQMLMMLVEQYDKVYYYDDCSRNIDRAPDASNIRKYKV